MLRTVSYIGLFAGILVMLLLFVWQGFEDIFLLLADSGWMLLTLPVIWFPSLLAAVVSWRILFDPARAPSFKDTFLALWVGRAINTLLPVATIGGEITKARLLILWGREGIDVSATVVVDKTVQALALIPWAILGSVLLVHLAIDFRLAGYIVLGTLMLGAGIVGFILVQRAGMMGFLAKIVGKFNTSDGWGKITTNAHAVDARIREIYGDRKRFLVSIAWRTLGLILQTGEVWLACSLLGHPIGLLEAMMLKSLTSILTDIAFVIPNGYGVQEGGYVLLGALVGLSPDFALAVSLATRIRELLVDLPGLLYWHQVEARYFLKGALNKTA